MRKLLLILSMLLMGAVLSLAFPRASLWPIAWVALVPLLIFVRDSRPRTAALAGYAFGIGFFATHLYWIYLFGYSLWILLTLIEALSIALFGALASIVYRSRRQWLVLLAVPALWPAVEWLRMIGPVGFPWGYLAYSQARNLPAVQIANLTGAWGLTFLIVMFNAALASHREKMPKSVIVAALVAALVHTGGYWSMKRETPKREKLAVTVLQGAVRDSPDLTVKQFGDRMVHIYTQLTREAADYNPDLVVWPESAVPGDIIINPEARGWIAAVTRRSGAHMLVGGPRYVPATRSRPATMKNGAYMLAPNGAILGSYYRVRLTPFGEFIPGRNWLPFLDYYKRKREVDIVAGKEHNLLRAAFGKAGVMICFESGFPSVARTETRGGANLLCLITREVLFEKSAELPQHHDFAIFRAVENRRSVVRSGESGISSIIDPCGRVQGSLGMWERGVLYGEVEIRDGLSIYTRFGDWFLYLCIMIAAYGVGSVIAAQRKKNRAEFSLSTDARIPGTHRSSASKVLKS